MKQSTGNIIAVISISRKLLRCADKGDLERNDDSCGVLFGMTRDCAYKIMDLAMKERSIHQKKGTWDTDAEEEIIGDETTACR